MSNSNQNYKKSGKASTIRSYNNTNSRKKINEHSSQMTQSSLNDGIYTNERFVFYTSTLIGSIARLTVKDNKTYEGIFKTFDPKFSIVLEKTHLVNPNDTEATPSSEDIEATHVFKLQDVISIELQNVDMDYAVDSFTDGSISKRLHSGHGINEKKLQPWEDPQPGVHDVGLEETNSNGGWNADEMFRVNREKYQIKSDYDQSLSQYTTPVPNHDTEEFQKYKEKAALWALEIETSTDALSRAELENTKDEETLHSAVIRDKPFQSNVSTSNSYAHTPTSNTYTTNSSSQSYKNTLLNGAPHQSNKTAKNETVTANNSLYNRNLRQQSSGNNTPSNAVTMNTSLPGHTNSGNQDLAKFSGQKVQVQQQHRHSTNASSPITSTSNHTHQSNNMQGDGVSKNKQVYHHSMGQIPLPPIMNTMHGIVNKHPQIHHQTTNNFSASYNTPKHNKLRGSSDAYIAQQTPTNVSAGRGPHKNLSSHPTQRPPKKADLEEFHKAFVLSDTSVKTAVNSSNLSCAEAKQAVTTTGPYSFAVTSTISTLQPTTVVCTNATESKPSTSLASSSNTGIKLANTETNTQSIEIVEKKGFSLNPNADEFIPFKPPQTMDLASSKPITSPPIANAVFPPIQPHIYCPNSQMSSRFSKKATAPGKRANTPGDMVSPHSQNANMVAGSPLIAPPTQYILAPQHSSLRFYLPLVDQSPVLFPGGMVPQLAGPSNVISTPQIQLQHQLYMQQQQQQQQQSSNNSGTGSGAPTPVQYIPQQGIQHPQLQQPQQSHAIPSVYHHPPMNMTFQPQQQPQINSQQQPIQQTPNSMNSQMIYAVQGFPSGHMHAHQQQAAPAAYNLPPNVQPQHFMPHPGMPSMILQHQQQAPQQHNQPSMGHILSVAHPNMNTGQANNNFILVSSNCQPSQ